MLTLTHRSLLSVACSLALSLTLAGQALAGQAPTELFWGLTTANTLVRFSSTDPGTILRTLIVTGLPPGDRLLAIEVYALEGIFAGLCSDGQLYAIDRHTGQATLIRSFTPVIPTAGSTFGMTEDGFSLYVVSSADVYTQVYKGWEGATSSPIEPPGHAVAIAVTSDGRRIVLDSAADQVSRLDSVLGPATALTPLGPLGVDTSDEAGLDRASSGDTLWAALTVGGAPGLYTIGATGAASLVGPIGSAPIVALAVDMPGVPQVTLDYFLIESNSQHTVLVRRTGDTSSAAEFDVTMRPISGAQNATAGVDFVAFEQVLAFGPEEIEKQFVVTLLDDAVREPNEEITFRLIPRPAQDTPWGSTIYLEDDDNRPPVLTMTSPGSPLTVTTPTITLTGTFTDEDPGVRVLHNHPPIPYFTFGETTANPWLAEVPLQPGLNRVGVIAYDIHWLADIESVLVIRAVPAEQTFVFAEGSTGVFFDTDLLFANPNPADVPVTIDFMRPDGSVVTHALTLPAERRTTLSVDTIPGLEESYAVASTVRTSSYPIAVERTMRWGEGGYGAHTEKASGLSHTWFFAEGSQGFFHTYLLLVNPHATENEASVRFLRENDTPVTRSYTLAPHQRLTIDASTLPEVVDRAFGMEVRFAQPAVAERSMYFGASQLWAGGHASAGTPSPANEWFLAEGTTGPFMETFVLLANPASEPTDVTLRFLPDTGMPVTRVKTIPAAGRLTVNIEDEDPALANVTVATQVNATRPIVAERAQYWPWSPDQWYESHGSFGVTEQSSHLALAEGRVGGPEEYKTYILLANAFGGDTTVRLRFLRENGAPFVKQVTVPANSRFTVAVDGGAQVPEITEGAFAVDITSNLPIVVERSMYANVNGQFWASGTNATATRLP